MRVIIVTTIEMKNLHKYIFTASVATSLLLSAGFALAQTPTRLEELREAAEARAQKARGEVQGRRDEAQVKIKEHRENVRERIAQIKDQQKQKAAEKITNQMDHINDVWTNHFVNVLDRLDAVLQKIKSRTEKAGANGADVSGVNTAIASAETAIATARTAVALQAEKTYVPTIPSLTENTSTTIGQDNLVGELRKSFKELRNQLFADLTALRDGVMKDTRIAVKDAARALSQIPHVDEEPAVNTNN